MSGVTYDAGALIAADRNDRRMWALHVGFLAEEVVPVVPAPVVAEAWRGGSRQANLSRLLAGCEIEPMDERSARSVGEVLARAGLDDVVDGAVVETASRRTATVVVTSDRTHIRQCADAIRARVKLEVV